MGEILCKSRLFEFVPTIVVLLVFCQPISADLAYLDFSSTGGLVFNGDAAPSGDVIRVAPAARGQVGSMWYVDKQQVNQGFTSAFAFQFTQPGGIGAADGVAFVIQNSSVSALGGWGGGMGYDGISNSIAIEFDTWMEGDDISVPHISVQSRGTQVNRQQHAYSLGATTNIPNFMDNEIHRAEVSYTPGELAIFIDPLPGANPSLIVPVDLSGLLNLDGGKAWVGFTSATGNGYQNHDILSWEFTEIPEPATLLLLGLGGLALLRRRRQA